MVLNMGFFDQVLVGIGAYSRPSGEVLGKRVPPSAVGESQVNLEHSKE